MYLVFDIGGTHIRAAVSNGQTLQASKTIPAVKNFTQALQALKQTADELARGGKFQAVSGGVAIILDSGKTKALRSTHLKDWIFKPLKQELEQIFQAPVSLENDSHLAGLGEATYGAGLEQEIVAYLTISTGVGGVKIVDQKIDKNSSGFEPGHQIIIPDGNLCDCGGRGHLETYIAGSYFEKNYHQKGEDIKDPKIWDEVAKYLSIGLTNTIVHWSPDIVILGGSVTQSIPLEAVQKYLNEYLTVFPKAPPVVESTLGDKAGLYGALSLLK